MGSGFLHGVRRERLTAEGVAEAVGLLPVTGSGHRVSVVSGRGGTSIGFTDPPLQLVDFRLAVVVNKGPKGEADFADERYWTIAARPAAGAKDAALKNRPDAANYSGDWWVPASNLSEWATGGGTHSLAVDGKRIVVLFRLVDQADNERFVFDAAPSSAAPVLLKILTATGSAGQYNATVYDVGAAAGDGTGAFAPPQSLTAGASVLAWNQDEQFIGVNRVKPNSYALGIKIPGMSTETPPRPIYLIARGQYLQGEPSDPTAADFDPEPDPTADTTGGDTWDARDPGTGTLAGVAFNAVVLTGGMEWKSGPGPGGHIAYRYRVITVDADGRIAHWGTAQDNSVILPG